MSVIAHLDPPLITQMVKILYFKNNKSKQILTKKTVIAVDYIGRLNAPRQRGTELLRGQSSRAGETQTAAASAAAK